MHYMTFHATIQSIIESPKALNVYWMTNNLLTIAISTTIRQPGIKERLGIGEMIKHKPEDLVVTKNLFGGGSKTMPSFEQ